MSGHSIIYGLGLNLNSSGTATGNSGRIWEIDPIARTAQVVYATGLSSTNFDQWQNAVSYDTVHKSVLLTYDGSMYAWGRTEATPTAISDVTQTDLVKLRNGLHFKAGAYYNNAYWASDNSNSNLYESRITTSASGAPQITADPVSHAVIFSGGLTAAQWTSMGDFAIDANGVLYDVTNSRLVVVKNGATGSLTGSGGYQVTASFVNADASVTTTVRSLAFNSDFSVLYGQDNQGNWYTLDKTTGAATDIGFTTAVFSDLGGSSTTSVAMTLSPQPVTGPVVSPYEVNEGAGFAYYTVTGLVDQTVVLSLQAAGGGLAEAALTGADVGTISYLSASNTWTPVPAGGVKLTGSPLQIRVAIVNDTSFEGPESFRLQATYSVTGPPTVLTTIYDNGTGTSGTDDDRAALAITSSGIVNEGAGAVAFTISGGTAGQTVTLSLAGVSEGLQVSSDLTGIALARAEHFSHLPFR